MSARLVLNQLRAQELKQLCKEEGLDHNGSKRDLALAPPLYPLGSGPSVLPWPLTPPPQTLWSPLHSPLP